MGLQFIAESPLSLETIRHILSTREEVRISPATAQLVRNGYDYLQRVIREEEKVIYGINTGFGALCNVRIADEDLRDLQANLVMSHACGTGDLAPEPICRLVLLLKILA